MNRGGMMDRGGMMEREAPSEASAEEKPTIFLTKDQLGGADYDVGGILTLKVTDRDPESGEFAFEIVDYTGGETSKPGGYEADFEEAIPPEGEEA